MEAPEGVLWRETRSRRSTMGISNRWYRIRFILTCLSGICKSYVYTHSTSFRESACNTKKILIFRFPLRCYLSQDPALLKDPVARYNLYNSSVLIVPSRYAARLINAAHQELVVKVAMVELVVRQSGDCI